MDRTAWVQGGQSNRLGVKFATEQNLIESHFQIACETNYPTQSVINFTPVGRLVGRYA